jgi:gas vesicle protein
MKRLKGILIVVLIFLCGVFVGATVGGTAAMMDFVNKTFRGGPPNIRKLLIQRAKHDLKLDEDQNHQFWAILNDTGAELRDAVKPVRPQIDAVLEKSAQRMREVLQPWQQASFDRFTNEVRKRWLEAMKDPSTRDEKAAAPPTETATPR